MAMILKPIGTHLILRRPKYTNPNIHSCKHKHHHRPLTAAFCSIHGPNSSSEDISLHQAQKMVNQFDPKVPIEEAVTPPSSWYKHPSFLELELHRVFYRGWQAVGHIQQIKDPHDFFTGRLGDVEFVVCRDDSGKIHAFHNVCRHHASLLASGSGQKSCFVCPYHAWTYGLDGHLVKATRIMGIQNFNVNEFGLIPIKVATWGPFILLNLDKWISPLREADSDTVADEWLGSCSEILSTNGVDSLLSYVCRREYTIECNWKVFCDNYLDGGYHVPYAHKGLAFGLQLQSYSTTDDKAFIEKSLEDSERVQIEDIVLCEGVQKGLESPAYSTGRFAPTVEKAMYHFHGLLHQNLTNDCLV